MRPKSNHCNTICIWQEPEEGTLSARAISTQGVPIYVHGPYLSPDLCAMPLPHITPLCLSNEWDRLLESGGRHRKTKEARPLSAKMVRNIAGVVSSAFVRAVRWGLATFNPVTDSEPPVPVKHQGVALTPAQQSLLIEAASGCWCLSAFLELSAATGARRGEVSGVGVV